ncbi:hypothetical protein C0Q70_15511 [Pomacea canaliculata]|uniref:ABC transporter domain-containing protein n=1 Tax=Pomacea canaliculata TaxID=400727 RepID=A0A2T7NV36_POMCA|nr:hypothetical protein C0Q70_15511 [Pomacea canaliculata]
MSQGTVKVGETEDEEDQINGNEQDGFTNHSFSRDGEVIGRSRNGDLDFHPTLSSTDHQLHKDDGWRLQWSRFKGMFVKKVLISWRHRVISIVQLLLPVLFTIFALLIDVTSSFNTSNKELSFDLSPFGSTRIPVCNGSNPSGITELAAQQYMNQFSNSQRFDMASFNGSSYNNFSEYIVNRANDLTLTIYKKEMIVGALFETSAATGINATAYYNSQPYHALPISVSLLLNGLARTFFGASYSISTSMLPFPKDLESEAKSQNSMDSTQGFMVGFCISFGMSFLTSSFVYFLVGSKHLQVVSGVSPTMFWLATLVWDYINYLLVCFAMLIVFAAFQTTAYVADDRLGLVLLVLLVYGLAILPSSMSSATCIVTTILVWILTVFVSDAKSASAAFEWIFLIFFPNYSLTKSFMDIYSNYGALTFCNKLQYTTMCPNPKVPQHPCCKAYGKCPPGACRDFSENFLAWESPGAGRFIFFLLLQGLFFMTLTLAKDYNLFQRLAAYVKQACTRRSNADVFDLSMEYTNGSPMSSSDDLGEDSDVARERQRINNSSQHELAKTDSLLTQESVQGSSVHKTSRFTAVNHVCVGVPENECFGLLGQNGAGKTTTFKMLTGDVPCPVARPG